MCELNVIAQFCVFVSVIIIIYHQQFFLKKY